MQCFSHSTGTAIIDIGSGTAELKSRKINRAMHEEIFFSCKERGRSIRIRKYGRGRFSVMGGKHKKKKTFLFGKTGDP